MSTYAIEGFTKPGRSARVMVNGDVPVLLTNFEESTPLGSRMAVIITNPHESATLLVKWNTDPDNAPDMDADDYTIPIAPRSYKGFKAVSYGVHFWGINTAEVETPVNTEELL